MLWEQICNRFIALIRIIYDYENNLITLKHDFYGGCSCSGFVNSIASVDAATYTMIVLLNYIATKLPILLNHFVGIC